MVFGFHKFCCKITKKLWFLDKFGYISTQKIMILLFFIRIALIFFNFVTTKYVHAERNESVLSIA